MFFYRTFNEVMLLFVFLSVTILVLVPLSVSEKIRYDNYRVFQITVQNTSTYNKLENFVNSNKCQFWRHPRDFQDFGEVLIPPQQFDNFTNFLKRNAINFDVTVDNVQRLIDEEEFVDNLHSEFNWKNYYNLESIYAWLDRILAEYPDQTSSFTIGNSYEGRTIRGLKISYKPNNPGIFIESNLHAREWITSATATYLINELLTSTDANVQNIARNFDWYIIPVVNVDGFVYSHRHNRLWRKTRQRFNRTSCIGTDPNRNFDSFWMANGGASRDPCSSTYAGPKPFSEPETLGLANFYRKIQDKISMYIAFHCYGQYILTPYGHTNKKFPENHKDLMSVSKAAANAIRNLYGTRYRFGAAATISYVASGCGVDWAFNEMGTRLAFTFEFRDKGKSGFLLPAKQIIPNAEETLKGIVAMIGEANRLSYF